MLKQLLPQAWHDYIDEHLLGRNLLTTLDPSGPKNLRDSEPIQVGGLRQARWPFGSRKQDAKLEFEQMLHEKPLPALPLPGTTSVSHTQHRSVPEQSSGRGTTARREKRPRRGLAADVSNDVASVFTIGEDEHSTRDLHIPIRAFKLADDHEDYPGHALFLFNPDFSSRLAHLLQARKVYEKANHNAELEERATSRFIGKLRVEIVKCQLRLQRWSPDTRSANQYNDFDDAASGPSPTALKLERKLDLLSSFLERTTDRRAETEAALEQQTENLHAAQAAINADFEKVLSGVGMLSDEVSPPSGAEVSDVIGDYKAFCLQNGIKWDDREAESLPASLTVGVPVIEVD